MGKNVKGGNKAKKQKNSTNKDVTNKVTDFRDKSQGQVYGVITKVYGGGRVQVSFIDDINFDVGQKQTKLGIVRGSSKKGKYKYNLINVRIGNVILISLRSYDKDKVDVLYRYNDYDINVLRKGKHINEQLLENTNKNISNTNTNNNDDGNSGPEFYDEDDEVLDEKEMKYKMRKRISYSDIFNELDNDNSLSSENESI